MGSASLEVRVARKIEEAVDICLFELTSIDGGPLPAFSAGSHIDVTLPGGLTRQYSLCNDSSESHRYLIGVLKDPNSRGGSKAMHEKVAQGDLLRISAPKNHFPLAHDARRALLLAGGIGITPILCMAERLSMIGTPFHVHYCTRSPERTAFRHRIKASPFAAQVHFHFDDGPEDQKLDLASLLALPDPGRHLYVCGPKGFMDAALALARQAGWSEASLHYEFFTAETTATEADNAFDVQLASSGRVVSVPVGKTVVQALADAGVVVQTSCEQGVCGTCVTRVLEGEIDHRDMFLTPQEQASNALFTPCCSRARSRRLVLDL